MVENNQKVDILGSLYTIVFDDFNANPEFKSKEACGFCDHMTKKITICNVKTMPDFLDATEEYVEAYTNEILRHELFHAFLFESGLAEDSYEYEGA